MSVLIAWAFSAFIVSVVCGTALAGWRMRLRSIEDRPAPHITHNHYDRRY